MAGAAVIPPGSGHEIIGGSAGLLVWVDADGLLGQVLTAQVQHTALPVDLVTAWAAAAVAPH